ncbi:hypothetical protein C772_01435 [Bhargavaea cecembensis DSE10]|uniref:DUF1911 domain-containing protein n=1 Tax=Bhargavaea cecembensis DSE10 TaxID=1235279 RepID=M7NXY3_9BACL|nr:PoNe immunity protein domain-containing protein [Bhargavaea cecembensis]EMR06540.1 hypothetical protein C772_01435 [Bhargavaea cecembensis DSE10]
MRDPLKDEAYFMEYLTFQNQTIAEFEELLETVIRERGVDDEGVRNGYIALSGYHFNRLIAMYSAGGPLDEIRDALPPLIGLFEKTWEPDDPDSLDDYVELVWLLSIGIMLGIDEALMSRLDRLAQHYAPHDALIDFLLNARRSVSWKPRQASFVYGYPYNRLLPVIEGEQSIQRLNVYLENDWYRGHDGMGWHDSHLHQDPIYRGYWSFESGAIMKILVWMTKYSRTSPTIRMTWCIPKTPARRNEACATSSKTNATLKIT